MKKFYLGFVRAPLFYTAILLGTGIVFSAYFPLRLTYLTFLLAGVLLLVFLCRLIYFWRKIFWIPYLIFSGLVFALVVFGAFYYQVRLPPGNPEMLEKISSDNPVLIRAKVQGLCRRYERYSRVLCQLIWLDTEKGRQKLPVRFWFNYFEEQKLYPGDEFVALVRIHLYKRFRNPGVSDFRGHLSKSGIYCSMSQTRGFPILKIYHRRSNPLAWLEQVGERFKEELKRSGVDSNYLLLALLLGDKSEIPESLVRAFRATGMGHILVVSGLHLSLISGFGFIIFLVLFRIQPWLIKRFDPYPLAGVLSIVPITFYALLTGLTIPVTRAYIMALTLLLAISLHKIRNLLNSLGLAGLVIILLSPWSIFDASFILSFLSVAVLIIYFPVLWWAGGGNWFARENYLLRQEPFSFRILFRGVSLKILEYIYGLMLGSLLIQLFLAPIVAYYFSQLILVGFIGNILIVPLCGFWILPLGLSGLFFSLISSDISDWFLQLSGLGAFLMEKIANFLDSFLYASFLIRASTIWEIGGWYLILFTFFHLLKFIRERKNKKDFKIRNFLPELGLSLAGFMLGISLCLIGVNKVHKLRPLSKEAKLTVLDVGLGQSILIDLPGRYRILIDGGGSLGALNLGEAVVGRYLLNQGIRQLDAVILTHPQADHGEGLKYILSEFKVKEFWLTEKSNQLSETLLEIAHRRKVKVKFLNSRSSPEKIGNAILEFLNPAPEQINSLNLNDSSLVIKMTYGATRILFPGEISTRIEKELLRKYPSQLKSQILIAPHHGSNTSSSAEFLEAVSPDLILISSGSFGEIKVPSQATLERMQKTNAKILRTDLDGALQISF